MKYPILFCVPVLMVADYFLTVAGAILRERTYSEHFQLKHYEMNPLWQNAIARKKWFNPRHLVITGGVTVVFYYLFEYAETSIPFMEGLLASVLVLYAMINGRHLSNILIFRYLNNHPDQITGHIQMEHRFVLFMSTAQYVTVLIPIAMLAWLLPSPQTIGGLAGILLSFVIHIRWGMKYKKKMKQEMEKE